MGITRTCPLCRELLSFAPVPPAQGPVGGGPPRVCAVGMAHLRVFTFPVIGMRSGQLLILSLSPLTLLLATVPQCLRHGQWGSTTRVKPVTDIAANRSTRLPGHGDCSGRGTRASAVGGSPGSLPHTVSPGGRVGGSCQHPVVPRQHESLKPTPGKADLSAGRKPRFCPRLCA